MDFQNLSIPAHLDIPTIMVKVQRGAARLDAFEQEATDNGYPPVRRWFEIVDPEALEIACPVHSVLGQLFFPYVARGVLTGHVNDPDPISFACVVMSLNPLDLSDMGYGVAKIDMDAFRRDESEIPRDEDEMRYEGALMEECWRRVIAQRRSQ